MRGLQHCEKLIELGLTEYDIRSRIKTRSSRNINYWLERGYSENDAKIMVRSRIPGTFEYYKYFKNVESDDIAYELSRKYFSDNAKTKENYINKFGEVEGIKRWESYCKKQSIVNTFEYKHKKYGWTKKQFDSYNKSRSVTLDNLISRHGEERGKHIWDKYRDRQSYTNSLEYFKEKLGMVDGERKWNEINFKKAHTFEVYLERYDGNIELATEKLTEYFRSTKSSSISSKISITLFDKLTNILIQMGYSKIFHHGYNQEWVINVRNYKTIFLDFYLRDTGKVIEFFGDYWHCNPIKYESEQSVNIGGNYRKVSDIWNDDRIRIDFIEKMPYINDVLVIWENDFRNDPDMVVDRCIEFLTK
jgi:hypothetical protein